jgi:hypothetical protein
MTSGKLKQVLKLREDIRSYEIARSLAEGMTDARRAARLAFYDEKIEALEMRLDALAGLDLSQMEAVAV